MRSFALARSRSSTTTRATALRSALRSIRSRPPSARASCMRRSESRVRRLSVASISAARASVAGSLRLRPQPLRLRDGACQRRPQLVGGVGGEAAFGLERLAQPGQKAVQGCGQRADLRRQVLRREPPTGRARRALRDAYAKPAQGIEAEADGQDDGRKRDRQHDQQRQAEAHPDLPRDRRAMRQRFGHRDADRPLKRGVAVEPVSCGLTKPRTVVGRKHGGVGRMGLQQDAPLVIADDDR